MNGKIFYTIILSITMSSFLFPGIASLNNSIPQAKPAASVPQEPVAGSQGSIQHVYVPLVYSYPADTNPVVVPPTTGTPEPTQPEVTPTPVVKLPMENDYHSQRWETSTKNACGPTALLMVLDYYDQNQSLSQVIRSFKISPSSGGFDPNCKQNPVCLSPSVLEQVAQNKYKLEAVASDGWTFDQVYDALSRGQPVIADVTWRLVPGGTGHFVVIYGIDREKKLVYYHDPFDGAGQTASWDEFSASWNGPVDAGDPLQPAGHGNWGMALAK